MRRLLAGCSVMFVLGLGGSQALPVTVPGDQICPKLPDIPFLPTLPCLNLPALPIDVGALPLPALPLNSLPSLLGPLPQLPQVDLNAVKQAAGVTTGTPAPDYSRLTQYLFHFPDTRIETLPKGKLPYLSVNNTKLTGKNEWIVPFSQESASVTAALGIRKAWQRFEDRYYWRANVELNNPALFLTNCIVNLGLGLQTATPTPAVSVAPSETVSDPSITSKFPYTTDINPLGLDSYFPLPQVDNADYCRDLKPNLIPEIPVMYLPGVCFSVFGVPTGVCIEGDKTYATNPLAPAPLYFNMDEARVRLSRSVKKAHSDYLLAYQQDVVAALFDKNNSYFFPLPWRSLLPGDGAVIAPVMNLNVSPKPVFDLASQIKLTYQADPKARLFALNSYAYYFQSALRSPALSLHTLPGRTDVLASPPGVWLFEEYKRLLPVSSLRLQEEFGYTTFFEAYNLPKAVLLPEAPAAKLLRPLLYYATGLVQDVVGATVILPQPMRIPEYLGGLPFAGPQTHYEWKSVPEGYQIPRVSGEPLFDYTSVAR